MHAFFATRLERLVSTDWRWWKAARWIWWLKTQWLVYKLLELVGTIIFLAAFGHIILLMHVASICHAYFDSQHPRTAANPSDRVHGEEIPAQ